MEWGYLLFDTLCDVHTYYFWQTSCRGGVFTYYIITFLNFFFADLISVHSAQSITSEHFFGVSPFFVNGALPMNETLMNALSMNKAPMNAINMHLIPMNAIWMNAKR